MKRLLSILLCIAMLCMMNGTVLAISDQSISEVKASESVTAKESIDQNVVEETAIKKFLAVYFDNKYSIMSTLTPNNQFDSLFLPNNSEAANVLKSEKTLIDIEIGHKKLQVSDLRFDKYTVNLDFKEIVVEDNDATVTLEENSSIYFHCSPNKPSVMNGLQHIIKLHKLDNSWYIVQDIYESEWKELINNVRESALTDEQVKSIILKRSLQEVNEHKQSSAKVKTDVKNDNDNLNSTNVEGINATASYYSYNYNNAVTYADTYGSGMNSPPWGNYESLGGDCTNFASQCINAGGVPMDNNGSYTWYWYSDSNRVPSWTGVSQLYSYLLNNNSSSSTNYGVKASLSVYGGVTYGDIIQNVGSHTMVIDGFDWDGDYGITDYYICQHSTGTSGRLTHYPLSSKPPATRAYIDIQGYYK